MTFASQLTQNACQIALDLGIVPQTTLTAPAAVGDTAATVADVRPFLRKTIASFWDGSGEWLAVQNAAPAGQLASPTPVPGIVTFDFSGGPPGLQADHAAGARLATNLLDTLPVATGEMLDNGWPVVAAFVLSSKATTPANRIWQERGVLSVVYQLPAQQGSDDALHPQLFVRQQTTRTDHDISLFVEALRQNYDLAANGIVPAEMIEEFVRELRARLPDDQRLPVWEQYLDITLCGFEDPIL